MTQTPQAPTVAPVQYAPAHTERSLARALIVDLDGTTCLMGDRGPFDWRKVHLDTPNGVVIQFVQHMNMAGVWVLWVSGRMDVCRDLTREWLDLHAPLPNPGLQFLHMRKDKDNRDDTIVKEEIYREHIEGKYDVLLAVDDRTKVVNMWRDKLHIPVWQQRRFDG